MSPAPCPTENELRALHAGSLAGPVLDRVVEHVERCERCADTVRSFERSTDPIVAVAAPQRHTTMPRRRSVHVAAGDCPELPGYEMLHMIGRGGMGVVFKARHRGLNRLVAVKMLLGDALNDPEHKARFRIEAEALARLHHTNVVQIFDFGTHESRPYLALEYVDGGTLNRRLGANRPGPRQIALWIEAIARGMHHAHAQGIVHRDLKPSNVLMEGDTPKVADFGIARDVRERSLLTATGQIFGTPQYMAPEQAAGDGTVVGPAADIYALGAILYHGLTGAPPFDGTNQADVLARLASQEVERPSRKVSGIPRDLETIALHCLEKLPAKRYATAGALADDLHRFLNGEPIAARRVTTPERAWKWAKRNPLAATSAAMLAVVCLAAAVTVTVLWLNAERNATAAHNAAQLAEERSAAAIAAQTEAVKQADNAETARRRAEAIQAGLALDQGLALCDNGDIDRGLRLFSDGLDMARRSGATQLERAFAVNIADWAERRVLTTYRVPHGNAVRALALHPNGKLAAAGNNRGAVLLFDPATGKPAARTLQPFGLLEIAGVRFTGLAFNANGTRLAGVCDSRLVVWDCSTWETIGPPHTFDLRKDQFWGVHYAADGEAIYVTDSNGTMRQYNPAERKLVPTKIVHGVNDGYFTSAFHGARRRFATGSSDTTVRFWQADEPVGTALKVESLIEVLAFDNSGERTFIGTRDAALQVWDWPNRRLIDMPSQGHSVIALAVSPDGSRLAAGTKGGLVTVFEMRTLKAIGPAHRVSAGASALLFADNDELIVACEDGVIHGVKLPRTGTLGPLLRHDDERGGEVFRVAFSADGKRLLVGGTFGARVWDPETGIPLCPPLNTGTKLLSAALSRDGTVVAAGAYFGKVDLFALDGSIMPKARFISAGTGRTPVRAVTFSGDDRRIVAISEYSDSILVRSGPWWCELAADARPRALKMRDLPEAADTAFRPGSDLLALACRDGCVRFWNIDDNSERGQKLEHGAAALTSLCFSPNGRWLATGGRDARARVWDVTTGQPIGRPLLHPAEVTSVAISADGQTVLTGCIDGAARFWDVASGRRLGPEIRHTNAVLAVALRADGAAAIGGRDRAAQLWRGPGMTGR